MSARARLLVRGVKRISQVDPSHCCGKGVGHDLSGTAQGKLERWTSDRAIEGGRATCCSLFGAALRRLGYFPVPYLASSHALSVRACRQGGRRGGRRACLARRCPSARIGPHRWGSVNGMGGTVPLLHALCSRSNRSHPISGSCEGRGGGEGEGRHCLIRSSDHPALHFLVVALAHSRARPQPLVLFSPSSSSSSPLPCRAGDCPVRACARAAALGVGPVGRPTRLPRARDCQRAAHHDHHPGPHPIDFSSDELGSLSAMTAPPRL